MTAPKDGKGKFAALMEALAEHAEKATDREILEDAAADGVDVKSEADRIRGVLAGAVLATKKQRLTMALTAHTQQVAVLNAGTSRLPATPAARRELLQRALAKRPDTKQLVMITVQHRDFEELTDLDVESALRQLAALGLLDDTAEDE